jgi:hypothetical protein
VAVKLVILHQRQLSPQQPDLVQLAKAILVETQLVFQVEAVVVGPQPQERPAQAEMEALEYNG